MSAINLIGSASTPAPSIYVNFRTFTVCPGICNAPSASRHAAGHRPGQSWQLSAAPRPATSWPPSGRISKPALPTPRPSPMPISPPPWRMSLGFDLPAHGKLTGRVISEALAGGGGVDVARHTLRSDPGPRRHAHRPGRAAGGRRALFRRCRGADRVVGLTPHKSDICLANALSENLPSACQRVRGDVAVVRLSSRRIR